MTPPPPSPNGTTVRAQTTISNGDLPNILTTQTGHGYCLPEKNPDYLIEGRAFDSMAPGTAPPRNIASNIKAKVDGGQTKRVVLNLDDSVFSTDDILKQVADWPDSVGDLREMIIIKDGVVTSWVPDL